MREGQRSVGKDSPSDLSFEVVKSKFASAAELKLAEGGKVDYLDPFKCWVRAKVAEIKT